jgi:hypothetical protein
MGFKKKTKEFREITRGRIQKTLPRRIDQRELGKLIIQMAEQNKEKERCSGCFFIINY